jgi:heat-inducible transcriptional repressor
VLTKLFFSARHCAAQAKQIMSKKDLSERKQKILTALVEDYILSAEPVSSKDIQSRYMPDISSATIRSELAALEEMGFLEQTHISSGRVPLPEAYRYYVEKAIESTSLTKKDVEFIKRRFQKTLGDIKTMSAEAAKILSDATNYTSVFISGNPADVSIIEVKLVPMSNRRAVVLMLTSGGMLADKTVSIPEGATLEGIQTASGVINKVFSGKNLAEIERFPSEIEAELAGYERIFSEVVQVLKKYVADNRNSVYVEGALKMLDYPECGDVSAAKKFLQVISDESAVKKLVSSESGDIEYTIKIGKDAAGIENCSVVTAEYKVNGQMLGLAGVIGPERMDYKRVISVLACIKQSLNAILGAENTDKKEDIPDYQSDKTTEDNDDPT